MNSEYTEGLGPMLPAGRASVAELADQIRRVSGVISLAYMVDFPIALLVLNSDRQIVYGNARAQEFMRPDVSTPLGLRPGEAFACDNARLGEDGCGTGALCRYCGAAKSLAAAFSGKMRTEEFSIARSSTERIDQLDLQVWSKPIKIGSEIFYLFSVIDISERKRRESFERIFLHDLMNTAGSLSSLMHLIDPTKDSFPEHFALAREASDQLVDELVSHRMLSDAEMGNLPSDFTPSSAAEIVDSVVAIYRRIAENRGIGFVLKRPESPLVLSTDPVLLKRVLSNLIKNAIEASVRGQSVGLSFAAAGEAAEFSVTNAAVIPESVRSQLFHRSFSTKARGRGLGTYAARLFVEEFLNGTIRVESGAERGTAFIVSLPL